AVGVVFTRRTLIDADGRPLLDGRAPCESPPRGLVLDEIFRQNFICFSSVMLRAEVAEHVGRFDERLELAIDYDFWLRVAQHYLFDCIDEPLTAYRVGHANLSRRQLDRLHIARTIMQRFRNHYRGDEYLDPSAVARAEAETDCHLSVMSRGYSRLAAAEIGRAACRVRGKE